MRKRVTVLDIGLLKNHEEVNHKYLKDFTLKIRKDGCIKNPVVVENKHFIILDGHHRVAALKILKANKVPVILVTYQSKNVRVFLRRDLGIKNIKKAVISCVLAKKMFPEKTTRHFIKHRPRNINVKLESLGI
jgi:hypothetical protein